MDYLSTLSILCMILSCWAQQEPDSQFQEQLCAPSSLPRSINDFGAKLTQNLGGTDNQFISPMSIFTALAMTYLGARTQTAQQMENALQMSANGINAEELHESFKNLLDTIKNSNDDYSLSLANGMFLHENYEVNPSYTDSIQTFYSALLKSVNFISNAEGAKNEINQFVSENTQDKLKDFLQEPLDPSTVLALINAIYFKGTWLTQFPEELTRDGLFHTNTNSTKTVKFMTLINKRFPYFYDRSTHYKFLELPYKGNDVAMLLAVPDDYHQNPDLSMTSDLLCHIKTHMRRVSMTTVSIPKFQLKYRKNLVNNLQQLGIHDLFSNGADLTGISSAGDLKVSNIVHEAVIDVNEQGSEAAAATGVFITRMSLSFNELHADHPFAFYIIDKRNNLVLFSGRVADP